MFLISSFNKVTSGTVEWLALSPQLAGTFVGEICMFQRLSISFFRLNGNSQLAIGVNISVNSGLSLC